MDLNQDLTLLVDAKGVVRAKLGVVLNLHGRRLMAYTAAILSF
ncbi:hypothetical protein JCM19239_799 [Vibrio variabilis]|uniref:Uncharacterized protein n=1 Tax=Vibrio variabilis TaxID=990271 RepID=A0ABQ0JKI9_9VIBR|nr:hypothetical protein JCM19239_799 [Vibrio variabilis]